MVKGVCVLLCIIIGDISLQLFMDRLIVFSFSTEIDPINLQLRHKYGWYTYLLRWDSPSIDLGRPGDTFAISLYFCSNGLCDAIYTKYIIGFFSWLFFWIQSGSDLFWLMTYK